MLHSIYVKTDTEIFYADFINRQKAKLLTTLVKFLKLLGNAMIGELFLKFLWRIHVKKPDHCYVFNPLGTTTLIFPYIF